MSMCSRFGSEPVVLPIFTMPADLAVPVYEPLIERPRHLARGCRSEFIRLAVAEKLGCELMLAGQRVQPARAGRTDVWSTPDGVSSCLLFSYSVGYWMGKGGMRWGAGRPAEKGKAEDCLRLDVREWHRRGTLVSGYTGSWSWSNSHTGKHAGSIGFRIKRGAVVLDYNLNGEPQVQHVPILHTACTYGGTRPWFGCPRCHVRVAVIYLRHGGFYCRKCAHVSYRSQSEDVCGRAWRKQQKAEAKLGVGCARPKGMHIVTRERLLEIIFRCEERRDDEIARFIGRYVGVLGSL